MASTIQIKHGTGSAVPSSLLSGELALNVSNGKLYYGTSGSSNAVPFFGTPISISIFLNKAANSKLSVFFTSLIFTIKINLI